jgi:hypothetical protein
MKRFSFQRLPPLVTTAIAAAAFVIATAVLSTIAGWVVMPLTLVACGTPFAGAILGVLTYRVFNLWLPLLPAAGVLPRLRARYGTSFQPSPHKT